MRQLDLAKQALGLVEGSATCSAGHQAQKHSDALRSQHEDVTAQQDAGTAKIVELTEKAEELQNTIFVLLTDQGAVVKAAKTRMAKAENALGVARALHADGRPGELEKSRARVCCRRAQGVE
eukprot:jgi/Ulvmu1/8391/UM042_0098.1